MARYNVISVRVTDEDFKLLHDLAGSGSVSNLMRSILDDYVAHIKEVCHDAA